jgi:small subunit ribosomal protein S2
MSEVTLQQLLMAGSHFGHLTRRWNPKMKPYIFMEKNGIYILDLNKTLANLKKASAAITQFVQSGEKLLFIGTKRQAKDIVRIEAERCNMPYVTERWLGGTLTNFSTIKKSIKHLKNLDKMATDGTYDRLTKKEILQVEREKEKLEKNLGGIKDMPKLPGAVFIVDTKQETIAVAEARKLGIPIFGMVDTNADPDPVNHPIPANDDAFKSISLIVHCIADSVLESRTKEESAGPSIEEGVAARIAEENAILES